MKLDPIIIFEDDLLLVVVKPAGMVVNRAETVEVGTTLQDWVEEHECHFEKIRQMAKNREIPPEGSLDYARDDNTIEVFLQRSGIAHRLDKETSGVMLIGKNPKSLEELMRQFKVREIHKEYVALVHGILEPQENTINLPIKRSIDNRHKFKVDVDGKAAITRYVVEKHITSAWEQYQDGFTLVRLFPKTGRTHQIRVHMNHIGHPLVSDELYGGRKRVVNDLKWCPRHFLHAATITLTHPATHESVTFTAPLPEDLRSSLVHIGGVLQI